MSATLQAQARALGNPTRHQVFRFLADADHPVAVSELTKEFGLNHNAIRQHLAKLVDAGLVVERVGTSSGRGRPPLVYEVDPSAPSRWDIVGPYERLALWLAEVVSSGHSPIEVGRRAGRRQLLLSDQVDNPRSELVAQMARQGFDPVTASNGDVILHNCPFESTALVSPDVVCNLHLGFAEGVAEQLGGVRIGGLQPHDPRHARCRLRVNTAVAPPTRAT